jgi:ribosome recycling factor
MSLAKHILLIIIFSMLGTFLVVNKIHSEVPIAFKQETQDKRNERIKEAKRMVEQARQEAAEKRREAQAARK